MDHNAVCIGYSKFVKDHPQFLRDALQYFEAHGAPWCCDNTNEPRVKKRKKTENACDILEAVLQFLQTAPEYFVHHWKWSEFISRFLLISDTYARWLACHCISIVLRIPESRKQTFMEAFLAELHFENARFNYACKSLSGSFSISECPVVLWKVPEIHDLSSDKECLPLFSEVCHPDMRKVLRDVSAWEKNDMLLEDSLPGLGLAVSAGKPVCLIGPVGCGKTSLVQRAAEISGKLRSKHLYQVQLGEEMDSKLLLGSYHCTDIPGEFIWKPGVLTKAVMNGDWILLEDIDSATSDVISTLSALFENNSLNIPGYRDNVMPTPGFQVFFTQRTYGGFRGYQRSSASLDLLRKHWLELQVESRTRDELIEMIQKKYSQLSTIAHRMVDIFLLFSSDDREETMEAVLPSMLANTIRSNTRCISTRDLIKWCNRAVVDYNVKSPESQLKVIQNAIDLFCCSMPNEEFRLLLACEITTRLGVVKTKAEYFFKDYKPVVTADEKSYRIGRARLDIQPVELPCVSNSIPDMRFALTRFTCCLMERIACCIEMGEPVLLVGETGTGKTATLQLLAKNTGNKLIILNMNQQSDTADLLGGYKPATFKHMIGAVRNEWESSFRNLFSVDKNAQFLNHIANCYNKEHWQTLLVLIKHSQEAAVCKLKINDPKECLHQWINLGIKIQRLQQQLQHGRTFAFTFVEGALVKALREGHWILLDEINLASAETLQCLSGMLELSSLSLYEKGDVEPIKKHPNFRLVAAMNPATDVGKKQLPPGIRNRFTELYVNELTQHTDLNTLVACYLRELSPERVDIISKFYLKAKQEAASTLSDGIGHKPYYSLRTLCRALTVGASNPCSNLERSLYEGFCLSFLTQLDHASYAHMQQLIKKTVFHRKNPSAVLNQPISCFDSNDHKVKVEGYWINKGDGYEKIPNYILTSRVRKNLLDLARIVSLSTHPVLIQGDTSVGKTSLVTYLAAISCNRCFRINNHEHTDVQEYIGTYSADPVNGQLVFKEGILVESMRKGYWIILDELNLAPSDVLEALNRVLDDNRELYIPETQVTVVAHPNFRVFATQNPPGLYGGRKALSRAFRNRFVELHFSEIPAPELEIILKNRCDIPASYASKMVAVMKDLQAYRRSSATFAGKHGFITLRDLFRWGERYRLASVETKSKYYDWDQHLADEGYLVLAGRVRRAEESQVIVEMIEKHLKRKVDIDKLFTLSEETSLATYRILETVTRTQSPEFEHIAWTYNMRKMAVLVGKALEFKEPVLLVGETGCGKTTICQLLACLHGHQLYTVNCHQHSESSDFIGGLRPVRKRQQDNKLKLFEWVDGPLVKAMKSGGVFLVDEISLADDSVLERLNSLLEPERALLINEKVGNEDSEFRIVAHPKFNFLSTMNPSGDYGKKELSPALRNRLTEIWCESCSSRNDFITIIRANLKVNVAISDEMMDFVEWLRSMDYVKKTVFTVRDLLLWVNFINATECEIGLSKAYIHGASLVFLDKLGASNSSNIDSHRILYVKDKAMRYLQDQLKSLTGKVAVSDIGSLRIESDEYTFGIAPFYISKGRFKTDINVKFEFRASTTAENLMRLLRALQMPGKAILLEGSPGVGKTSLVESLAKASGHGLVRINLSEQTDISDLFGTDLPVEGARGGVFEWRDGPFLKALKNGDWILLDELNLASQSVLEGLNAVLDHRNELYIPELGKNFKMNTSKTCLFACQNPMRQGGARKGLPKSFLNRFIQVYIQELRTDDFRCILNSMHPSLPLNIVDMMVSFNSLLIKNLPNICGSSNISWEMNLRDLLRWCEVTCKFAKDNTYEPGRFVSLIYGNRMRSKQNKKKVEELFISSFGSEFPIFVSPKYFYITPKLVVLDDIVMDRDYLTDVATTRNFDYSDVKPHISVVNSKLLLRGQIETLRSLAVCVQMNWLTILIGGRNVGKTSIVQTLAQLCSRKLEILSVNNAMDSTDIIGGFEQVDYNRRLEEIAKKTKECTLMVSQNIIVKGTKDAVNIVTNLFSIWEAYAELGNNEVNSMITLETETKLFMQRLERLNFLLSALLDKGYFCENVTDLIEKLEQLKTQVELNGSVNSGGRFEWVDSLLLKCVSEGYWLLIKNVNLCSPAILDRLNGLVEPGGVLSLNEKGVDSNGNLVLVKPHPNFRLFFTMDPGAGEISRAMRNRGLEIFVSRNKMLDEHCILYSAGLLPHGVREVLLEVHSKMKNNSIERYDPVSFSHLQRASFLIAERLKHNFPYVKAIEMTCKEVYAKSRNLNAEDKKSVAKLLEDVIRSKMNVLTLLRPCNTDMHILNYSISSTSEICFDTTLHTVRKESSMLLNALFYSKENPDVNLRIFLSWMLKQLFLLSTQTDLKCRKRWVINILEKYGTNVAYNDLEHLRALAHYIDRDIVRKIESVIPEKSILFKDRSRLPLDVTKILSNVLQSCDIDDSRMLSVNEFVLTIRIIRDVMDEEFVSSMLLDTSVAFDKGHCTSRVMSEALKLFRDVDRKITSCIDVMHKPSLRYYTAQYGKIIEGLLFGQLFTRSVDFISTKCENSELTAERAKLHLIPYFQWLNTKVVPAVEELVSIAGGAELLNDLKICLKNFKDPALKIPGRDVLLSKKLRKAMHCRQLVCKIKTPETTEWIKYLTSESLTVPNFIGMESVLKCFETANKEISTGIKNEFIRAWHTHLGEEFVGRIDMNEQPIQDQKLDVTETCLVEVSPILAAIAHRLESVLKVNMYSKLVNLSSVSFGKEICSSDSIASVCLRLVRSLPYKSPLYMALLDCYANDHIQEHGLEMLLVGTIMWESQILLPLLPVDELHVGDELSDVPCLERELVPACCPSLLMNMRKYLVKHNEDSVDVVRVVSSLARYKVRNQAIFRIKELLCDNAPYLTSTRFDYWINERKILKLQFYYICKALAAVVPKGDITLDDEGNVTETGMRHLLNVINEQVEFEDMKAVGAWNISLKHTQIDLQTLDKEMEISFLNCCLCIGRCWMVLGYMQFTMFSNIAFNDPNMKRKIRLYFYERTVKCVEQCLLADSFRTSVIGPKKDPAIEELAKWKESLEERCKKIRQRYPHVLDNYSTCSFYKMFGHIQNFKTDVMNRDRFMDLVWQLNKIGATFAKGRSPDCPTLSSSIKSFLDTMSEFMKMLNEYCSEYSEITVPLKCSIQQLYYGANMCRSTIEKAMHAVRVLGPKFESNGQILKNLIVFPKSVTDTFQLIETLPKLCDIVKYKNNKEMYQFRITMRLIKAVLNDLAVLSSTSDLCAHVKWRTLTEVFDIVTTFISDMWSRILGKEESEKALKESLYVFKSQLTEEPDVTAEDLFPSTYDTDFSEINNAEILDREMMEVSENSPDNVFSCTQDDLELFYKMESIISEASACRYWLKKYESSSEKDISKWLRHSFEYRLEIFELILQNSHVALMGDTDIYLLPSLVIMADMCIPEDDRDNDFYDFYRHSNIDASLKFIDLLYNIESVTCKLLSSWPDHPTLKSIVEVSQRIKNFAVTSPLSRFLDGAQLLLDKIHEWEEVACKEVSYSKLYEQLTDLIFQWRKMEIANWCDSIRVVELKMNEKNCKFWFHLRTVCSEYIDNDTVSYKDIVSSIRRFIETADLACFKHRLKLLFKLHCYYSSRAGNSKLSKLCRVLWHIYSFYSLFITQIEVYYTTITEPVRKKLKNYGKIIKWNDINYWSVKTTVEKTKQTFAKYLKEYQKLSSTKVSSVMSTLPLQSMLHPKPTKLTLTASYLTQDDLLLEFADYTVKKLSTKARTFCDAIMKNIPYSQVVSSASEWVESTDELIKEFDELKIDPNETNNKKKSQAKSILQRKKKALSDVFKMLSDFGLSYKTGLIGKQPDFCLNSMRCAPIELEKAITWLMDPRIQDEELISVWSEGDKEFYINIAQYTSLKLILDKPHKDVSLFMLDRIKGFTNQLMSTELAQRKALGKEFDAFYKLRILESLIRQTILSPSCVRTDLLFKLKDRFVVCVNEVLYFLRQLLCLLNTYTKNEIEPEVADSILSSSTIFDSMKNYWLKMSENINADIEYLVDVKNRFNRYSLSTAAIFEDFTDLKIITSEQYDIMKNEHKRFRKLVSNLRDVNLCFSLTAENNRVALCEQSLHVSNTVEELLNEIQELLVDVDETTESEHETVYQEIENVRLSLLLSVERLYKKYATEDLKCIEKNEVLKYFSYVTELNQDVCSLCIQKILSSLKNLLKNFWDQNVDNNSKKALRSLAFLLNQYSFLTQFLLTQKLQMFSITCRISSSILQLFSTLVSKGFDVPDEFMEDEKASEGSSQEKGGFGLSEGEGIKDVSDQIESEDQLEDARLPGEEKVEEDRECQEEENGIEMSEDFDGKSHDMQKPDEDETDKEESDEEDVDKEMGETGKEADNLDQQIWGSDEEQSDKEDEPNKKSDDTTGGGEKTNDEQRMDDDDDDKENQPEKDEKHKNHKNKSDIDKMDEDDGIQEDQIDPYHGNFGPLPEPDPLDLPKDLRLDEGDGGKSDEDDEENPFDIDVMKEQIPQDKSDQDVDDEKEGEEEDGEREDDGEGEDDEGEKGEEENEDNHDETGVEDFTQTNEMEEGKEEDGGRKDAEKTGEEQKDCDSDDEKKQQTENTKSQPSYDEASKENVEPAEDQTGGTKDMVASKPEDMSKVDETEESYQQDSAGPEQKAIGMAERDSEQSNEGHCADQSRGSINENEGRKRKKRKNRAGEKDSRRTMADRDSNAVKRLKALDVEEEEESGEKERTEEEKRENDDEGKDDTRTGLYQHIRNPEEAVTETLDAATEEQAEKQARVNEEEEEAQELTEDDKMELDDDETEHRTENVEKLRSSTTELKTQNAKEDVQKEEADAGEVAEVKKYDIEGEFIETMDVERGPTASYHTLDIKDDDEIGTTSKQELEEIRVNALYKLTSFAPSSDMSASETWNVISSNMEPLAQELSEQLRLILDPTEASRLKGDFRTGRRINMKKVIPYIASEFRKDKIWLRRTKPSKREYQIILAIDNSSSMDTNQSKQMAFESLALISKALSTIEAGHLGVISFGSEARIIHKLEEQFIEESGAKVIQEFTFNEDGTMVASAVNMTLGMFLNAGKSVSSGEKPSQLLVMISDGRGVMNEGSVAVKKAVRNARQAGIFTVFLILDNPDMKDSILDIQYADITEDRSVEFIPYLDKFPFPYYVILRDITKLPDVLSDALRQWFELVINFTN